MRLQLLAIAFATMLACVPALAGDGAPCEQQGIPCAKSRCANCPHCGNVCYPKVSDGKKKKHCWKVEKKTICIPKVRFPWEKDCGDACCDESCPQPKCGRTKCVKVLMKHEYECHVCKYSWNPAPCGCEQGKEGGDAAPQARSRDLPPSPPRDARRAVRPTPPKMIYGYEDRL